MLFFILSIKPGIDDGCLTKNSLVDESDTDSSLSIIMDGLSASWSGDHKLVLSNVTCTVDKVAK